MSYLAGQWWQPNPIQQVEFHACWEIGLGTDVACLVLTTGRVSDQQSLSKQDLISPRTLLIENLDYFDLVGEGKASQFYPLGWA